MSLTEPASTAAYLAVLGLLLALAAGSSRLSTRAGVPAILVFLLVGIAAGSGGIGGIHFDDHQLAFRIGTVALAVILAIRGDDLLAPRDDLRIEPGDHVFVLCDPRDRAFVRLFFGHEEDDDP